MKNLYETYIRSYYSACRVGMRVVYGGTGERERERERRKIHARASGGVINEYDCRGSCHMSEVYL